MRKVTQQTTRAFVQRQQKKVGNTESTGRGFYLHGNRIAWWGEDGDLFVTLAGWPTVTTRERLNGLFRTLGWKVSLYQQDFDQYLVVQDETIKLDPHDVVNFDPRVDALL